MVVKKSGKKAPPAGGGHGAEGNNSDLAAMRGTLEDYFNSKKAYQTDQMRELNKEVTKHLLTGDGDDNAMVMERQQDESRGGASARRADAAAAETKAAEDAASDADDGAEPRRRASESESGNDYEDDYESDSSATATGDAKAAEKDVAGMTLGDYLHAKGDGVFPLETEGDERDEAKRAAPKPEKLPQKPSATSKKPLPPAVISGMSLDYYLGASSVGAKAEDDADGGHVADSKSPPRRQKKNVPNKVKTKSLLAALPARQPPAPPPDYSTHDEFATPFQKRVKKQTKLKQQQQQHIQQGGAVAKSILLGDSHSSSQLLTTKHLPASCSSSSSASAASQTKDKKKHGGAGSQPPLPKLLGASSSTHSFLPAAHYRDPHSDGDDGDFPSGFADDDSADEKLPPLQHQYAGHK